MQCNILIYFLFLIAARVIPFRVGVNFDSYEVDLGAGTAAADAMANADEQSEFPGGILGFRLKFEQNAC